MPPPVSRSSKTAPTGSGAGRRRSKRGGGGLVSTADDYLAFASALLAGGTHHGERVLSRPSVTLMTSDQLTPAQKAVSGFWPGYFDTMGWGFGMSVRTRRTHLGPSVGSYGWPGFYGTAWYNDPAEDMTTIFIMQRAHAGDQTAADVARLLDRCLPGDRRLTAGAGPPGQAAVSACAARRPAVTDLFGGVLSAGGSRRVGASGGQRGCESEDVPHAPGDSPAAGRTVEDRGDILEQLEPAVECSAGRPGRGRRRDSRRRSAPGRCPR